MHGVSSRVLLCFITWLFRLLSWSETSRVLETKTWIAWHTTLWHRTWHIFALLEFLVAMQIFCYDKENNGPNKQSFKRLGGDGSITKSHKSKYSKWYQTQSPGQMAQMIRVWATPRTEFATIGIQICSTLTAIFPCVALSWRDCFLLRIIMGYCQTQKDLFVAFCFASILSFQQIFY